MPVPMLQCTSELLLLKVESFERAMPFARLGRVHERALGRWAFARRFAEDAAPQKADPDFLAQLREIRNGTQMFQDETGVIGAARKALLERGKYRDDRVSWQMVLSQLTEAGKDGWEEYAQLGLHASGNMISVEADVTQSSFWEKLTKVAMEWLVGRDWVEYIASACPRKEMLLTDRYLFFFLILPGLGFLALFSQLEEASQALAFLKSMELARLYTTIGAWHVEVFKAVFENQITDSESRPDPWSAIRGFGVFSLPDVNPGQRRQIRYSEIHSIEVAGS
ncbi:unnamed protein product [Symbiodinium microadriaticum]|nr:unnamed protein product [Symbiodinium microadriaticum]